MKYFMGITLLVFSATIIGLAFLSYTRGEEAMFMFISLILAICLGLVFLVIGAYFITYKEKDDE